MKSTNKFVHLTNDAVQKYSEDYGKYEPANKLSFADMEKYMRTNLIYPTPVENAIESIAQNSSKNINKLSGQSFLGGSLFE